MGLELKSLGSMQFRTDPDSFREQQLKMRVCEAIGKKKVAFHNLLVKLKRTSRSSRNYDQLLRRKVELGFELGILPE